jgi:hypothetical protein
MKSGKDPGKNLLMDFVDQSKFSERIYGVKTMRKKNQIQVMILKILDVFAIGILGFKWVQIMVYCLSSNKSRGHLVTSYRLALFTL